MVGKICTVCRRCSYIDKQLSFFTYPGDQQRRHEWLKAVDRLDLMNKVDNYKTRGNHRICEVHFEEKYVKRSPSCEGRKFLTKDAFPTLCLDNPSLIVPMTSDNFLKPPTFQIWGGYHASSQKNTNVLKKSFTMKQDKKQVKPERKSVRQEEMALKKKLQQAYDLKNEQCHINIESPPSPLPYEDISQFCESVMKVSKGTQTFVTENNRRNIDDHKRIKTEEVTNINKQSFLQMCSKFLPPSLYKVVKWNLCSTYGRQNVNFVLFAINLYYSSNLFNLLRDMLRLPSKKNIKYFLLPTSTKLSENFINAFRCKVNNMSTKERICSFSVGSTLLRPNLYYDIKHDRIIGIHDVNGKQNICVAKYAVLLMVQGILENWSQPIAYAFISEYDEFPEISTWIDEILTMLIDIGLDVRAFVSDPRSEFLFASESRFVTPEKSSFTVNGTDIFYTYDSMQLLKIVKNNLKSCDFIYRPNSKNCNYDFFTKLNDLCDVLNAKNQFANSPFKRAFSNKKYQNDFLNEMLQLFQNLKVVRKTDGVDVTENMKFVEGFQITIKSVKQLFEELNFLGVKYLLTSRLNHDSLNKFFKKIKPTVSKEECTPRQFNKTFVRTFVTDMLKKPVGDNKIENSLDSEEFSQQVLDEEFHDAQINSIRPLLVNTTDYRQGLPEKNAFVYVCGYCYLKCIQRHSCDTFKSFLRDYQSRQDNDDVTYLCSVSLDLNVSNCEMMPPDNFTEFLMQLEKKFKDYLKPDIPITHIGHEVMKQIDNYNFEMPCPCFPLDYLKALFVRVRLFYTVRKNNKLLRKNKSVKMIKVLCL